MHGFIGVLVMLTIFSLLTFFGLLFRVQATVYQDLIARQRQGLIMHSCVDHTWAAYLHHAGGGGAGPEPFDWSDPRWHDRDGVVYRGTVQRVSKEWVVVQLSVKDRIIVRQNRRLKARL